MNKLDLEIQKVEENCKRIKGMSIIEKLRPWVRLNNLLLLKIHNLLEDN